MRMKENYGILYSYTWRVYRSVSVPSPKSVPHKLESSPRPPRSSLYENLASVMESGDLGSRMLGSSLSTALASACMLLISNLDRKCRFATSKHQQSVVSLLAFEIQDLPSFSTLLGVQPLLRAFSPDPYPVHDLPSLLPGSS